MMPGQADAPAFQGWDLNWLAGNAATFFTNADTSLQRLCLAQERIANMLEAQELRSFVADCETMATRSQNQAPQRVDEFLKRAQDAMEARGDLIEPLITSITGMAEEENSDGS
jgi:acyl-CoA reductase-like NAD-dependent aldehyde dehydrogenase